jgi:CBS-domain-containing membrane protein
MFLAPSYTTDLARTIGVLQQLQVLLTPRDDPYRNVRAVTLQDVQQVLTVMQHTFDPTTQLEDVIQVLVGQHVYEQRERSHAFPG